MATHSEKLRAFLTKIDDRLASRDVFWRQYDATYREQARVIASQVMNQHRPADMPQDQWLGYKQAVINSVSTRITGFNYRIFLDVPGDLGADDDGPVEVTRKDLESWVLAGIRREPGAKRITPDDELLLSREGGMRDLIFRLALAYYGKRGEPNYERLRDAIQDWVKKEKGEADATVESFLRLGKLPTDLTAAIQESWNHHFAVIVPIDYRQWAFRKKP